MFEDEEFLESFPPFESIPPLDLDPYTLQVGAYLRKPGVIEHWRRRCLESFHERNQRNERHRDWEARRAAFIRDSGVQGPEAPAEGWEWAQEFSPGEYPLRRISAWVSPEYAYSTEPPNGGVLPFSKKRPISLSDCYLVLAAIHDNRRTDANTIWPFADDHSHESVFYQTHLDRAMELTDRNKVTVDDCLVRVEEDLQSQFTGVAIIHQSANCPADTLSNPGDDITRLAIDHKVHVVLVQSCDVAKQVAVGRDVTEQKTDVGQTEGTDAANSIKDPTIALLRVLTNGVSDERIEKVKVLLSNSQLSANEKLTKIHALMSFPATVSGEQLAKLLGVKKQAIHKTQWWIDNRKGEKESEIGRRLASHQKRASEYESPNSNQDIDTR